jgi:3-deoxy-D-manno-octulosonate 8-phosphate phosphatase (KDO 8-P phosphatase)
MDLMIRVPIVFIKDIILQLRLIVFDFDGVFTDNKVYVDEEGLESVRCSRSDGIGLRKLETVDLDLLILSSEENAVVSSRSNKLKIPCYSGCSDKIKVLERIVLEKNIDLKQVAYLGNDINDTECLKRVGLPIVVADAHSDVVSLAQWQTSKPGGCGAVREVCDAIYMVRSAVKENKIER